MWHPFAYFRRFHRRVLLAAMVAISLLAMLAIDSHGSVLAIESVVPYGILTFEFAGNAERAREIIAAWSQADVLHVAETNLYWDFGFIAIYAVTLSFITMLAAHKYQANDFRWPAIVLSGLTLGQWVAGGFDVMENCALLHVLHRLGRTEEIWPLFAAVAASIKFALIIAGLLCSIPAVFMQMPDHDEQMKRRREKQKRLERE